MKFDQANMSVSIFNCLDQVKIVSHLKGNKKKNFMLL